MKTNRNRHIRKEDIVGIPAKTDFNLDKDFVLDTTPRHYSDIVKGGSKKRVRPITPVQTESIMTPTPAPYRRNSNTDIFDVDTTMNTGDANVMVNEIAKLLDGHINDNNEDFAIKVRCNDDETKWLNVGYDVIYSLNEIINKLVK